jgi:hypothetical protein
MRIGILMMDWCQGVKNKEAPMFEMLDLIAGCTFDFEGKKYMIIRSTNIRVEDETSKTKTSLVLCTEVVEVVNANGDRMNHLTYPSVVVLIPLPATLTS